MGSAHFRLPAESPSGAERAGPHQVGIILKKRLEADGVPEKWRNLVVKQQRAKFLKEVENFLRPLVSSSASQLQRVPMTLLLLHYSRYRS